MRRAGSILPRIIPNCGEEDIESRIAGLVERTRAVFNNLFDSTTDAVVFDTPSSFLDGVRRLVDPVPVPVDSGDEAELSSPDDHRLGFYCGFAAQHDGE